MVHLQGGVPGLALHGLDAVEQLHKEVPGRGWQEALHGAQEAAEEVHLPLILVHARAGHQPPDWTCTHTQKSALLGDTFLHMMHPSCHFTNTMRAPLSSLTAGPAHTTMSDAKSCDNPNEGNKAAWSVKVLHT